MSVELSKNADDNAGDGRSPAGPSPSDILDTGDPGDDVQLRFRYQHAYAAIQCLRMLSQNDAAQAVFCENHEDVLIERVDGTFEAVQVKTRKPSRPPFKSTDDDFQHALKRFARLERLFSKWFSTFCFTTNHRFWNDEPDAPANPAYVLEFVRQRGGLRGLRSSHPVRGLFKSMCDEEILEAALVAVILKLHLACHESDLEHTYRDLITAIGETRNLQSTCTLKTIYRIADNLIFQVYQASSKQLSGPILDLYNPAIDFASARDSLSLAGKRLVSSDIEVLIQESLPETADNLLVSSGLVGADVLPPGMDVMREKLSAGGVQQERVGVIEDSVASLEKAYLEWVYSADIKSANDRLQHIRTVVRDDCAEAKVQAMSGGTVPYGAQMYALLRFRLQNCVKQNPANILGLSERHLLGVAGVLTEECTVWWSEVFETKSSVG